MFAGVLDYENWDSFALVQNCTFEENIGFFFELSAGGGASIMIKGNSVTQLNTSNCLFINSGTSCRGKTDFI